MHQLLDVPAGPQLVVVLDVVAEDAALVAHVLNPLDELGPAAGQLAVLGVRHRAREDEHGSAAAHGVVHHAANVLGAGIDVDHDRLRLTRHHGVRVGGGERHRLVRAEDELRQLILTAIGLGLGEGLDDAGVIAAEIGEDVADARFRQCLEERAARRVIALGHR